jgi:hypothetical protein
MFPNLTWDGAIRERDTLFGGLGDWLKETAEWVKDKDILLVIREHPQPPGLYNSFQSSLALLKELLPDIDSYDNVILIKGTEPVSSYQLITSVIDCSIVYNGTLGVEIPYMGEPVIIAADSPYSHKGVGYEPASKQEYCDCIMNVSRDADDFKSKKSAIQENALRAAAYQFVYNSYYCPFTPPVDAPGRDNKTWDSWDLNRESLDPNKNPGWERTLERFIEPLTGAEKR